MHYRSMETTHIEPDGDGSHCGLTDLYEGFEEQVRVVVIGGGPFHASWSSKKELWHAEVIRDEQKVALEVTVNTDEEFDLFDDAVWAICRDINTQVDSQVFSNPEDILPFFGIEMDMTEVYGHWRRMRNDASSFFILDDLLQDSFEATDTLPLSATYEGIMAKLDELVDEASAVSDTRFEDLQGSIWSFLEELTDPEYVAQYIEGVELDDDD